MLTGVVLLIATANPGKLREMRALFDLPGLELVSLADLRILQVVEEGSDYAENARLKAMTFAVQSGLWTVADDSGLEVDALDGAPGPHSARLAGPRATDADRRHLLLEMLHPFPRPWTARFRCTMALAGPEGSLDIATGICEGEIVPAERGSGGFGYDPLFLVAGQKQTMAELSEGEKNMISHRARAVQALLPTLRLRLGLEPSAGSPSGLPRAPNVPAR
jgi:XTP/dITP diphosphohydrolase